jgi:urease accessory protein UreF
MCLVVRDQSVMRDFILEADNIYDRDEYGAVVVGLAMLVTVADTRDTIILYHWYSWLNAIQAAIDSTVLDDRQTQQQAATRMYVATSTMLLLIDRQ